MNLWLRPLLILALALFATPRVMAADGDLAVICAADGSRQIVLFDFETGAPVEQDITFETCDHCLTPPIGAAVQAFSAPLRDDAADRADAVASVLLAHMVSVKATARGPPTV